MAQRIFFLTSLREGVEPADYERWARDVDLPWARSVPSMISYDVVRLEGPFRDNDVPYDYVEVLEVTDVEVYGRELEAMPDREPLLATWRGFIGESIAVHGSVLE